MGTFRIAKRFTFDAGHRLSKHPELCRYPHGHTYTVEVVVRSRALDGNDMVCDYKALKAVVAAELAALDHAMLLAASDPHLAAFVPFAERVVTFGEGDPTAEVLVRRLFHQLRAAFRPGMTVTVGTTPYTVPTGVRVERVRLWETPTSWAEYGEDEEPAS